MYLGSQFGMFMLCECPEKKCKRYATVLKDDGLMVCDEHFVTHETVIRVRVTKEECPVCLDEYFPFVRAHCGHQACHTCCFKLEKTLCPICRDPHFVSLVDYYARAQSTGRPSSA